MGQQGGLQKISAKGVLKPRELPDWLLVLINEAWQYSWKILTITTLILESVLEKSSPRTANLYLNSHNVPIENIHFEVALSSEGTITY